MRKYLGAVVAATAAAILTTIPAFASSSAVLSDSAANPNGTDTAVGAVITSGLKSGTNASFTSGSNSITCSTSNTSQKVVTNPPAPGTATLSLTDQSFSSCTTHVSGVNSITSITTDNRPYNASIASAGAVTISPGSSGPIHSTATVKTIFGQTLVCQYHVTDASGNITATASGNGIAISGAGFTGDSGNNAQCLGSVSLTVTYAQPVDSSNGNALVFVN